MAYSDTTTGAPATASTGFDVPTTSNLIPSPLMKRLFKEKKIAREFQTRRHGDWNETYDLYRNKIITNRLTQRQAVNIPLMKETVKTSLSKIDDPPTVDWKELSGDMDKQIIFQELWNDNYKAQNFEGIDIQDKKTVLLYGRSFRFLNWSQETVEIEPLDIYDVVVDPLTKPLDLESARFIIRQNIFRSLREVLADDRYDKKAKDRLKTYLSTKDGIIQSETNRRELIKKQQRLKDMGVLDDKFPTFSAGDVIVNLSEHYTLVWEKQKKDFVRHVVTYADDSVDLLDEELKDLLGVDFWPFVTWTEDIETNDFWSDGLGDLVRVPNKVLNVWFSQLVENRTLKNFQMHWYDASQQGYIPQTYEPGPGRMLPAPGDPNKTIMPVDISGLDDTLQAINFLTQVIERSSGVTALDKGQKASRTKQTKAEIQQLVAAAQERAVGLSKFYRRSWYELAMKWYKIMEANSGRKKTLYKTSRSGKIWPKVIYPSDWKSQAGYLPLVRSSSEQEQEKTKSIQRFEFVLQQFPQNQALRRVAQRRMLDILDLTPEELREVEDAEEQIQGQPQEQIPQAPQTPQSAATTAPVKQGSPEEQRLLQELEQKIGAFSQA